MAFRSVDRIRFGLLAAIALLCAPGEAPLVVIPVAEESSSGSPQPVGRGPYFEARAPQPERPDRAPDEDLLGNLALVEPRGGALPMELHALAGVSYFGSGHHGLSAAGGGGPFFWHSSTRGPSFADAGLSGPPRLASGGLPAWPRPSAPSTPTPLAGPPPASPPWPPDAPPPASPPPPRVLIPEPSTAALAVWVLVLAAGRAVRRRRSTLPRAGLHLYRIGHDLR